MMCENFDIPMFILGIAAAFAFIGLIRWCNDFRSLRGEE